MVVILCDAEIGRSGARPRWGLYAVGVGRVAAVVAILARTMLWRQSVVSGCGSPVDCRSPCVSAAVVRFSYVASV